MGWMVLVEVGLVIVVKIVVFVTLPVLVPIIVAGGPAMIDSVVVVLCVGGRNVIPTVLSMSLC